LHFANLVLGKAVVWPPKKFFFFLKKKKGPFFWPGGGILNKRPTLLVKGEGKIFANGNFSSPSLLIQFACIERKIKF